MYETEQTQLRLEALDKSVRVNLATGGNDRTTDTVERAEAFLKFLSA